MTQIARTIRLGDTEVTRIGLGTNRLRHTPGNVAFIREALAAGVGMIDTAHIYAGGESEECIGEALSTSPEPVFVATKGGYAEGDARPDVLRRQIETSLARLRTTSIDLYYLHRAHPSTPIEESVRVIAELRDAARIRSIGVSAVSVEQIEQARRVAPIAAVQNAYNLAQRESDDVVDHCAAEGIAFVPYYPLKGDHPALAAIAQAHAASPSQIALAWLLRRSPAMLPIPGSLSIEHVRSNVAALDIELSDDEFAQLSS